MNHSVYIIYFTRELDLLYVDAASVAYINIKHVEMVKKKSKEKDYYAQTHTRTRIRVMRERSAPRERKHNGKKTK